MSMWKRMLIAMISCVCMVHGSMNVWRYEAGKKLKDMHVSLRNLHQRSFTASVQTTGKTPDGDNVLRIVADDTETSKSDYGVQLCYDLSRPIEPEARYRLWFWCRASQARTRTDFC